MPLSGIRYGCQRCGRADGLDAVLPDHLWQQISQAAGGVDILCLWCMDLIAAELGIRSPVVLHYAGISLWSVGES